MITNLAIIAMINYYATLMGIDPRVAIAVVKVESNFNVNAVGALQEIGLFQIRPEYTLFNRKELLKPELNIIVGIQKLREAKKRCKHKLGNDWTICFNAGIVGGNKIKHPRQFEYVKRINKEMNI